MRVNKSMHFDVSVIIAMLNSDTTIIKTLESLRDQKYLIREIIIVDNGSKDSSMKLVRNFMGVNKKMKIQLIQREKNMGVGGSYNFGVEKAKSPYVIFMHSDGVLPTENEIRMLMEPFIQDSHTVASYSSILLPFKIWKTYPFWEKCLLARSVGQLRPGLNGKFDCVKKDVFTKIGGFDDIRYGHNIGIGGEDGDLLKRLQAAGKVAQSNASVIHLHSLNTDYSFGDWIINRKLLARSYGRFIRLHGFDLENGGWQFLIKPSFVLLSPFCIVSPWIILLYFVFSLAYMKHMYLTRETILNWRIYSLPFITIFLIYYETYWMVESFVTLADRDYNKSI